MLKIKIGHGAYPKGSANELAFASSKSEAVEILRGRGCKRDEARAALDTALYCSGGYAWVDAGTSTVEIEVQEGMPGYKDQIQAQRRIVNRNPNLALALFRDYKQQNGFSLSRNELAHQVLQVKRGIILPPNKR